MYINFVGGGLLGFGDIASFKFDIVHGSEKFYCLEWAQKFYAFRG